ncbi:adenylate cyclase associated N terminal-domain-containing protein [Suillus bovinus]|uniref:adenylate cyclase associated N terminal-domain-containing protein n=1 Tax=Suillus bovinus TaxID=48563 RepID=UPI001B85C1E3|nr:adenylate cyclase associated N terminal-domain-containing protein [Suillus bovinus]KAG2158424.1 adenylate cyclase associated N terminal-domain-containing protein [Suillus bovinus]
MSSSAQGLYSLATLIKRLEAITSRLEDVEDSRSAGHLKRQSTSTVTSAAVAETPSASVSPPSPPAIEVPAAVPRAVAAYDEIVIEGKLKPFLEINQAIAPPPLNEQVNLFARVLATLRSVLHQAAACRKPDQKSLAEILTPLQAGIEAVTRAKEAARKERDWFNHFTVIADGTAFVGWVTVEPKPGPYVNEIKESTTYYANRILKDFKEKDPRHAEWVRGFNGVLDGMKRYVMEFHTTGLVWNANGIPVSEYKSSRSQTISGPPPPPPPPPPPHAGSASSPTASAGGVAAVFADLNRGADVTKGLRKVDKSEMTHKNPALRAGSVVPTSSGAGAKKPVKPTKPQALMGKKPAKFALEGSKWIIEYQENESALEVANGDITQVISLFACKNTTVIIKGKVNAVTLVNCTKTSVLVESVVSSVSITKSPSFALQITGVAPTIQIDSTDSGQIYLSKQCLGVEITTAKCSAINVSLPVEEEEDGVFEEQAVPEMLKTVVQNGKLVTTIVEHAG